MIVFCYYILIPGGANVYTSNLTILTYDIDKRRAAYVPTPKS